MNILLMGEEELVKKYIINAYILSKMDILKVRSY